MHSGGLQLLSPAGNFCCFWYRAVNHVKIVLTIDLYQQIQPSQKYDIVYTSKMNRPLNKTMVGYDRWFEMVVAFLKKKSQDKHFQSAFFSLGNQVSNVIDKKAFYFIPRNQLFQTNF